MLRPVLVELLLVLLLGGAAASALADNRPPDLEAASQHPQWLRLLHYKQRLPAFRSDIDSPNFFLATTGKTDPLAELQATLTAFRQPINQSKSQANNNDHALCKYPARRWFLKRALGQRFAEINCEGFQRFLSESRPRSISLVFAGSYLGNPASAFGHSFLRLEPFDNRPLLLRDTINFAAHTNGQRGLKYSVRGLTGGYQGRFSILPFYQQVNEHNYGALRDLWSYSIPLTGAEIDLLMAHLWELRHARFDYYFIDENCSSQLLALLEVVWPQRQLLSKAGVTVIPAEMLRILDEQLGGLGEPNYQPALDVELREYTAGLSRAERKSVRLLGNGQRPPAFAQQSASKQAQLLDVAYDLLRLRWSKQQLSEAEWRERGQALLLRRAAINAKSVDRPVALPRQRPTLAHGAARIRFGGQSRLDSANAASGAVLGWRLVFHDLLDPRQAQRRGAEIRALDTQLYSDAGTWRLQSLDLVAMRSLRPQAGLIRPVSWQGRLGFRRDSLLSGESPLLAFAEGGRGLAWESGHSLLFAMGTAELAAARSLPKGWRLQAGGQLGWLFTPSATTTTLLEAEFRRSLFASRAANGQADYWSLRLRQQWMLTQTVGLRAELRRFRDREDWATTAQLTLEWYW